jgi:hypothetical protein
VKYRPMQPKNSLKFPLLTNVLYWLAIEGD